MFGMDFLNLVVVFFVATVATPSNPFSWSVGCVLHSPWKQSFEKGDRLTKNKGQAEHPRPNMTKKIKPSFQSFLWSYSTKANMTKINHHFFPTFCLLGHRKISRYLPWCLQVEGPLNGAKDEGPAESADKVVKVGMAGKTPNLSTDEGALNW